jgi:NADH:ubiquinone oxidoreductase subunit
VATSVSKTKESREMVLRSLVSKFVTQLKNDGMSTTMKNIWKLRRVKNGELKGVDTFGNQYFEGLGENHPRHRWVVYADKKCEASQIPPHWHKWLHHMTDETGNTQTNSDSALSHEDKWLKPHQENQTWTRQRYVPPGSLFRQKPKEYLHYEPWTPKK